jgi:hypothetical protein
VGKKDSLDINEEKMEIKNKIDAIDANINTLSEYPKLYANVNHLKRQWNDIHSIMEALDIYNHTSLLLVLTNSMFSNWYNYNKLLSIIELTKKKDEYVSTMESLKKIDSDLTSIRLIRKNDDERIREENLNSDIASLSTEIDDISKKVVSLREELIIKESIYTKLSLLKDKENQLSSINQELDILIKDNSEMGTNLEYINSQKSIIDKINSDLLYVKNRIKDTQNTIEEIRMILNDIKYTRTNFDELALRKENQKYILDAVSTKNGIPLILVRLFLDNCVDIINDLISDVFGDNIEIVKFKVDENEFKIPYIINGLVVDDIDKASQGQQSIISIALSFALIRRATFKYNIMLFDEVDGPLYEEDRNKFIDILMKQLVSIEAEQAFLITHNNTFQNMPVNILMTTDEVVDNSELATIIKI